MGIARVPFSAADRARLLSAKGIGPKVVSRLEQLGFSSLTQLARADGALILKQAAALTGSTCWQNSPQARAAIQAAIRIATAGKVPKLAKSARTARSLAPGDLATCANLGPKSAQMLAAAGITKFSQLQRLGSVAAYTAVRKTDPNVSLNLLWALEGAILETHWRQIVREHRAHLLLALDDHERGRVMPR
jgi:predicted flap endonuclease-1-like 5' DNA nuclease